MIRSVAAKAERLIRAYIPVAESKSEEWIRTGACARCGQCCKLVWKCPFLITDNQNLSGCRIHANPWRPKPCPVFPANPDDQQQLKNPERCGFRFKAQNSPALPAPTPAGTRQPRSEGSA